MAFDVLGAAVDYFIRERRLFPEPEVRIAFVGGEPFLATELIERATGHILRRLAEESHPWHASCRFEITTNGLLYTAPDVQSYLTKYAGRLDVSLSLDGTREAHDANRIHPGGGGSWREVMNAFPLWRSQFPDGRVRATVNPSNLPFLAASVEHLWSLGIGRPDFVLVQEDVWRDGDEVELTAQLAKVIERLDAPGFPPGLACSLLDENLGSARAVGDRSWCGAGNSMLLVDRHGDIYPCARFAPAAMRTNPARTLGNVATGLDTNRLRPFQSMDRLTGAASECGDCRDAPGCAWCIGDSFDADAHSIWPRRTYACRLHKARVAASRRLVEVKAAPRETVPPGDASVADPFAADLLVSHHRRHLQLSSVCNARCFYCTNALNPFVIKHPGFRSIESVRRGLDLLELRGGDGIFLSDSSPGRLAEGETLLHPRLFEILDLVRERFPRQRLLITTNGIALTDGMIRQLAGYRPMNISLSYHSEDPKVWSRLFGVPEAMHAIPRAAFPALKQAGFHVQGVMILLPAMAGYTDMQRTMEYLAPWVERIRAWGPGFSDRSLPEAKALFTADHAELSRFCSRMSDHLHRPVQLTPDPLAPLEFDPSAALTALHEAGYRSTLWLFSEAAYARAVPILEAAARGMSGVHEGFMVKNRTYGGNLTCAGCLLAADFRAALAEACRQLAAGGRSFDLVLMPAVAFDRSGRDLAGRPSSTVTSGTGLPHWLVWHDGSIFARMETVNADA